MVFKNNAISMLKYFIFFSYFSILYHLLCIFSGISNTIGLRESLYMSLLWFVPILFFNNYAKNVAAIVGLFLWLGSLFSLGYFCIYKQEFSQSVIFIIFESNMAESSEFLKTYFVWWMIPFLSIYSVIGYYLWKILDQKIQMNYLPKILLASLFLYVPFHRFVDVYFVQNRTLEDSFYSQIKKMEYATPWNIVLTYVTYKRDLSNMEKLIEKNKSLPPLKNLKDVYSNDDTTLVLVIGESTNRNRMSLYGYERDTTPRLNKIKDELNIFNNVYSPRPYTIEVLQQALSFADELNPELYLSKPNLINIMKQAGYETYWITNQQTQTKRNTMLTTFSQMCDHQIYLNNNQNQNSGVSYDEVVLKPFEDVLNNDLHKKRFIVVHLLGTHNRYEYRYPDSFAKFDNMDIQKDLNQEQKEVYNSYDNAVYYNDFVVSKLINDVKNYNSNAALLYLSDHGEEVYDDMSFKKLGRNESEPTKAMYTVPFMIYENEGYKNIAQKQLSKSFSNRLYSSSDLIYTFCDLSGIYFDGFNSSKSLINKDYKKGPIYIGDPEKKMTLRDLSLKPFKQKTNRAIRIKT